MIQLSEQTIIHNFQIVDNNPPKLEKQADTVLKAVVRLHMVFA